MPPCGRLSPAVRGPLPVLETCLGRLAVLICKDAIVGDAHGLMEIVQEVRPDLLLIVSMTKETRAFAAEIERLARSFFIGTLFVNAACVLPSTKPGPQKEEPAPEDRLLAACNLALWEDPGQRPTRLRWVATERDAECIYFKPPDGQAGWRKVGEVTRSLEETSRFQTVESIDARLLERQGRKLALLIDVGLHCRKE